MGFNTVRYLSFIWTWRSYWQCQLEGMCNMTSSQRDLTLSMLVGSHSPECLWVATDWRVRHRILHYLVVVASGELTKIQECCFHVDYLQGQVVFLLRVMRYMWIVRLSDGYMRGWQGLLCKNIIREVIIMSSTPVMWWNNSCQDYCVTRLWLPRPASEKYVCNRCQRSMCPSIKAISLKLWSGC